MAETGAGFEERHINLLRDTGRMRVEDLAARHLGVDGPGLYSGKRRPTAAAEAGEFSVYGEKKSNRAMM